MQNFDYMTPTRLIFGRESIVKLPEVMRPLGKRVLLTYGGGSIKKIGLYDRVKELLSDFEIFELPGIQPNPKYDPSVLEGVRICKAEQIDVILAVGGGSVLDCSKAIAGSAYYDGDPWDIITGKAPTLKAIPIVDILTLAATGSEYDSGGVISRTETNDKIGLLQPAGVPRVLHPRPRLHVQRVEEADRRRLCRRHEPHHRAVLHCRHHAAQRRLLRVDAALADGERPQVPRQS